MYKRIFILLLSWSLLPAVGAVEETGSLPPAIPYSEQGLVRLPPESADEEPPSIDTLLAEVNRNSDYMTQLLDKIVSEGCSRQLQEDTIKLVANMTRNIQIMTDVILRMGYNIEEMSRAPKAMNSFPFMP
jgi:hypothetical protein